MHFTFYHGCELIEIDFAILTLHKKEQKVNKNSHFSSYVLKQRLYRA